MMTPPMINLLFLTILFNLSDRKPNLAEKAGQDEIDLVWVEMTKTTKESVRYIKASPFVMRSPFLALFQ